MGSGEATMDRGVAGGLLLAAAALLGGCAGTSNVANVPEPASVPASGAEVLASLHLERDLIARGRAGRWKIRPMTPAAITIHATENFSADADARRHAQALKRGALRGRNSLGYLTWHFSVDDHRVVQHLPTDERGEHADFDGPGNRTSIGIEMCENRGGDRGVTIDRAARLAAVLAETYAIPTSRVVPHYHWPRRGYRPSHKDCPHFLLDRGRPGPTWARFQRLVGHYRQGLASSPVWATPGTRLALRDFCESERRGFYVPPTGHLVSAGGDRRGRGG